jgi:hypothetical protein
VQQNPEKKWHETKKGKKETKQKQPKEEENKAIILDEIHQNQGNASAGRAQKAQNPHIIRLL